MTDKEFKRLNRSQLIDIIYQLEKCIGYNLKAAVHNFMGVICL